VDVPPAATRQAEEAKRAVTDPEVFIDGAALRDQRSREANSDIVARLQNEVRSAWTKSR
jgi:hypothetical protein